MIYCYYDKEGILREIINDSDNRQGNNNTEIFVYSERDDIDNISVVYAIGDVRYPQDISFTQFANGFERGLTVPYNKNINYKYFKDNTPYNFYKFIVPVDIMQHNGTCRATFSIHSGNKTQPLGLFTFDIQDSVINKDDILTLSQWEYLLEEMAKVLQLRSSGVIGTNNRPVDGGVAPDNLDDGMFVLYYGTRTGTHTETAGENISGIELYEISGRTYQLRYESFTTSDRSLANSQEIKAHNLLYTQLKTLVDELAAQHLEFVKSDELSKVAFTGEYEDLTGKPFIPTKVSDLPNDSGFITNAVNDLINYYTKSETLTKDEIIARIGAIKTIKFEIYASLDDITNPQTNVIYLIGTESPYTEYAYIEEIGFEGIGSTAIDLSNYVQSDGTLNTNNIIVGSSDKKVKDSGYSVADSVDNNANKIPTNAAVLNEINKYHEVVEISGESGHIPLGALDTPYRLIKDENNIYYRLVSFFVDIDLPYYFYQAMPANLTEDHLTNYFLIIQKFSTQYTFTKFKWELVLHNEFDELVASTPTDVIYDKNTKVVQLTHDGMPIGDGAVVDINGFTPYYDGKTLVLSDVNELDADVATKEYVDKKTVIIPISSSSKGGTLNPTQLQTIKTATYPIINLNNEYFVKADIYDSENEFVFSHVGNREGALYNKTFTLNTQTGNWTLKEVTVQEVIDVGDWISNGIVPEEYRNETLLKKCVLFETDYEKAYVYSAETFDTNGRMVFSSISFYDRTLNVAQFGISDDWTVRDIEYIEINAASSASIVEDQGKLELATYNENGDVVDINETPNQFLQRRLDKPARTYTGDELYSLNYEIDVDEGVNFFHKGQIVEIAHDENGAFASDTSIYFIVVSVNYYGQGSELVLAPITPCYVRVNDKAYPVLSIYLPRDDRGDFSVNYIDMETGSINENVIKSYAGWAYVKFY